MQVVLLHDLRQRASGSSRGTGGVAMQYCNTTNVSIVLLGHQGEHLARGLRFGEPEQWQETYGSGEVQLVHQRPGEEVPYLVPLKREGGQYIWEVAAADTAISGSGKCELRYLVGETVVKSRVYSTLVLKALGHETEDTPVVQPDWVAQVLKAGATAEQAALRAASAAVRQPVPNKDTSTWWVWNSETGAYVDTGVWLEGSSYDENVLKREDIAQIVEAVQAPIFVSSPEEMTDTEKLYVLNGRVYACMTSGGTSQWTDTGREYGAAPLDIVSSPEEMTDTTRKYVLGETGTIWSYRKVPGEAYTNQVPISTDGDGTVFNGTGYRNDCYISSSSGAVSGQSGYVVTGFIPFKDDDVIRFKGAVWGQSSYSRIAAYDADKNKLLVGAYPSSGTVAEEGDGVYRLDPTWAKGMGKAYIRFSFYGTGEDLIVTINEEIGAGTVSQWTDSGIKYSGGEQSDLLELAEMVKSLDAETYRLLRRVFVLESGAAADAVVLPAYWEQYLPEKIAAIRGRHDAGGKDCFSFPVLTDLHVETNLGKRSGLVAKRIMDECGIKYALVLGDVVTRGAADTEKAMEHSFEQAEVLLSPIRRRALQTQGNHDGAWGAKDLDGDGDVESDETYCYNYPPAKLHSRIYRKAGLVGDCHFDSSGTGYYIDDMSNRVRYIMLNSHNLPYEENEDGTAKYNTMRLFRFGQSQYDMVVEALTTVPGDDWCVVTASHAPLSNEYTATFGGSNSEGTGDNILMRGLLKAYADKTVFSGTFAGTFGGDKVSVEADFIQAKGEFVAHFGGHLHIDTNGVYGVTVITSRCDGKCENSAELLAQRVADTVTEQSFDVFTIDRAAKTIYATKIGAGEDRVIRY